MRATFTCRYNFNGASLPPLTPSSSSFYLVSARHSPSVSDRSLNHHMQTATNNSTSYRYTSNGRSRHRSGRVHPRPSARPTDRPIEQASLGVPSPPTSIIHNSRSRIVNSAPHADLAGHPAVRTPLRCVARLHCRSRAPVDRPTVILGNHAFLLAVQPTLSTLIELLPNVSFEVLAVLRACRGGSGGGGARLPHRGVPSTPEYGRPRR